MKALAPQYTQNMCRVYGTRLLSIPLPSSASRTLCVQLRLRSAGRSGYPLRVQPVLEESELLARITRLSRVQKTVLAAICAERLLPLFGLGHAADGRATLWSDLQAVWEAIRGKQISLVIHAASARALVPDVEDKGWTWEYGFDQNAAAATAYAARTWISDDEQECLRACHQVYEAADYAAGREESAPFFTVEVERRLAHHPYVLEAVEAIWLDLALVETTDPSEISLDPAATFSSSWVRALTGA